MPDHAPPVLPRIALVFGDEAATAHVREAMVGCVDIVYAASASRLDAAHLREAQTAAVLVNVDGGDWLDGVESKLRAVGVPVVFNDPEISRGLDGWERARWLRHLVAKLRGCNHDVDPPRPQVAEQMEPAVENAAFEPHTFSTQVAVAIVQQPVPPEAVAMSMTEPKSPVVVDMPALALVDDDVPLATPVEAIDDATDAGVVADAWPAPDPVVDEEPVVAALPAAPQEVDFETESALDVDTEALSAMIDARLAESQSPNDSSEVWRVASGGAVSPVKLDTEIETDADAQNAVAAALASVAPAKEDDADVLASLPSLDDWALVDPEAAPGPTATKPVVVESLSSDAFAGLDALQLVPLETMVPLNIHADPIERWMDSARAAKVPEKVAKAVAQGDHKP